MPDNTIINTGLRGVTIASTKISDVNGAEGKLIYRGFLAKDLAEHVCFEEVVYLLLYEKLPTRSKLAELKNQIHGHSHLPDAIIASMKTFPRDALPMDVIQAVIPMLAHNDPNVKKSITRDMALDMAINLIAKMSCIVATWERIRKGLAPVIAAPELSHAANFMYMMTGKKPDKDMAHFMDTALVLHAEHSFNASTFAAREVASTRAHIYAAIAAAVGSLSGELHGGANTRVMEMLKKIGSVDKVDGFVENELKAGRKVMGLGHAVYKVDDPRALILAPMSKIMGEKTGDTTWYDISAKLEKSAKEAFLKEKTWRFSSMWITTAPLFIIPWASPWTCSPRFLPYHASRAGWPMCSRSSLPKPHPNPFSTDRNPNMWVTTAAPMYVSTKKSTSGST